MLSKCGAIYEVPADVLVAGLKAIGALPRSVKCEVVGSVLVKAVDRRGAWLPVVPEGALYPRRKAAAGKPEGEEVPGGEKEDRR